MVPGMGGRKGWGEQKAAYGKIKGNSEQLFPRQRSEHPALGGKPCALSLAF